MYFQDHHYKTDLADVNTIRTALHTSIYTNPVYLTELQNLICAALEVLSIEFNPNEFAIYTRIKKTGMRKFHGFRQNPDFYYQITPSIFANFIANHRCELINTLSNAGVPNATMVVESLCTNNQILANLCHVTCIADNIVIFKL